MLRRGWALRAHVPGREAVEWVFQTRRPFADHPEDILWDLLGPVPAGLRGGTAFDAMIALAGVVPRTGADLSQNSVIGQAAVQVAGALGIPLVLLASSSAVYGTALDRACREDDRPDPTGAYGLAKLEMEQQSAARAADLGITLCALRIGNVAGADALVLNGAALSVGAALKLDHFADGGTPRRSYIGPQTLCDVLCTLVQAGDALPPTLNIAAPVPVTMLALAQAAGFAVDLVQAQGAAHQNMTLECAALAALHGFRAEDSTPEEMIRQWRGVADRIDLT